MAHDEHTKARALALLMLGNTPQVVDAQLDHFSAAERARVKGGNLAALLGFERIV